MMAETFEEVLIIAQIERIVFGHFLVSESEKRALLMEALFVHTTHGPLSGLFQAAAYAFAARNFKRDAGFGILQFEDEPTVVRRPFRIVGRYGTVAGH